MSRAITREIGLRLVLGALPRDVVLTVVKKRLLLTITGMVMGFVGAIALMRVLATFLFGVAPLDLATFGVVTVLLATIGALSTYLPSRGAARVDPVVALREE